MNRNQNDDDKNGNNNVFGRNLMTWLLIALVLVVCFNIFGQDRSGGMNGQSVVSYSDFTAAVDRKEVSDVAISGDLKGSRTIHSFVYALARFGAQITLMPARGMDLPEHVYWRLQHEFHTGPAGRPKGKVPCIAPDSTSWFSTMVSLSRMPELGSRPGLT